MTWNHRTALHYDSAHPDIEEYLSVHEVYYEESGEIHLWNPNPASPRDKEEAGWIVKAFDKPPVIRVDDASFKKVADGYGDEYGRWEWIKPAQP